MKTAIKTLVALAMLALAGCVTNAPMDITQSGRESVIPADLRVKNIRLSVSLATLEDKVGQMGSTFSVHSGKVFRQVFVGGEDAPVSMDLVNSSMTQSMGDFMLLASKSNVTYTASVVLTVNGTKHTISSTATASTAWTLDRAAREAVERVVIDIARQSEVLLK